MHWNLRAMAMHLLRTLEQTHTKNKLVGEHLIPCCGHHIDHLENEDSVYIQGCFTGHNFWVEHKNENVELTTIGNEKKTLLKFEDYKNEVIKFAEKVSDFYLQSLPKKLPDDEYDRIGYLKFWKEWEKRISKWKKNAP